MNRITARCLAAVCLLTAGSAAHADQISYTFSTSYPSFFVQNKSVGSLLLSQGSGTMPPSITNTPTAGTISTDVLAISLAPKNAPQQIYAPIDLTLTDKMSNNTTVSKTVQLGILSGSLSKATSDLDFHSAGLRTVTFGQHTYKIQFASDTISPAGLFVSRGTLTFSVVDPVSPPSIGHIGPVPEPSSLLLAGIGVPLFGVFLRRRRETKTFGDGSLS